MSDVAKTILYQLGAHQFLAMTGARDLLSHEDALSLKLPRGAFAGINYVKIVLDPSDTYTVTFSKVHGLKVTEVACETGLQADALQRTFTEHTGLDTHL